MFDNKNISNKNIGKNPLIVACKSAVFPDEGPIKEVWQTQTNQQNETAGTRRSPVQFKEV